MIRRLCFLLMSGLFIMGFTSCQKEFSIDGMSQGPQGPAYFRYDGAPGACATAVVSGNYYAGVALDSSNKVTIVVTVTETGHYNVSTNSANGFKFTGSGVFTSTGVQTLKLYGEGTPAAEVSAAFVPEGNGCSFSVTTTTGPTPPAGYYFRFKSNGVQINLSDTTGALRNGDSLSIAAAANPTNLSSNVFYIDIIGSANISTGTYQEENAVPGATIFSEAMYIKTPSDIWFVDNTAPTPRTNPFKVNITFINSERVQGTFTGDLWDAMGTAPNPTITITEGEFNVAFE